MLMAIAAGLAAGAVSPIVPIPNAQPITERRSVAWAKPHQSKRERERRMKRAQRHQATNHNKGGST
jgi:hypothetical protein